MQNDFKNTLCGIKLGTDPSPLPSEIEVMRSRAFLCVFYNTEQCGIVQEVAVAREISKSHERRRIGKKVANHYRHMDFLWGSMAPGRDGVWDVIAL